ncbi:MAG: hypothetical protein AVDCRST_MAG53-256 [uncultured Solirubrobacteraceae bacterium]|uniref:CBM11 domain-containing protein n=1 Tax=uncultured Solirubrobacteraceae bacterium TaxID=1162706 RepID=A0A6J4RJP4_9ACTN|nr:MAG: hypothetical protein AVDCRST_MAG53-256 [uncultured Solirubrobacteraceae bacterium]
MFEALGCRLAAVGLGAAGALALLAPGAYAGPISSEADCSASRPLTQPFLPWADLANYALSPDGGLEAGGKGWRLSGGATSTAGNEPFFVGGSNDSRSLHLPSGSSATSAPTCVGLEWPTIRFFTRSSGTSSLSSLRVEVLFESAATRATQSLQIGTATPGGNWWPTPQMVMLVNTLGALSEDGMVPVAFRFTPVATGSWQIDDLYVDPWRGP